MTTAAATTAVAKKPSHRLIKLENAALLYTADGILKCVDTKCNVSVQEDSLVRMGTMKQTVTDAQGREHDAPVFLITAKGWTKIGDTCGVTVLHPETVIANGVEQPNGYQDPETGRIYFRSVAVGYTASGLTTRERTVMYDADLANLADLISKAKQKWNKDMFAIKPLLGLDELGNPMRGNAPGDEWAGYQLDKAMAMWVDTSCKDVAKWQGEMINRQEKGIRTCQTFADRNAIAAHPATPTVVKFPVALAGVPCRRWIPKDGGDMRITKSMIKLDMGMIEEARDVDDVDTEAGKAIDISKSVEEVDAAGDTLSPEDAREPDAPPPEEEDDQLPMDDPPPAKKELDRPALLAEAEELEKKLEDAPLQKARSVAQVGAGTKVKMLATEKLDELVALYRAAL